MHSVQRSVAEDSNVAKPPLHFDQQLMASFGVHLLQSHAVAEAILECVTFCERGFLISRVNHHLR